MQNQKISKRRNQSTLVSSTHCIRVEEEIFRKSLACSCAAFADASRRHPYLPCSSGAPTGPSLSSDLMARYWLG